MFVLNGPTLAQCEDEIRNWVGSRAVANSGKICYLCGGVLGKDRSRDHVPPKQFFATQIRKTSSQQFDTVPCHAKCNLAYKDDEGYLVAALLPSIMDSPAAFSRLNELFKSYRENKNTGLLRRVLGEWDRNLPEMELPPGIVAKRFDGDRVRRVIWKIVRGLHYLELGRVLPERVACHIDHRWPGAPLPEQHIYLGVEPSRGKIVEVFAYRFRIFPEVGSMQYWALYLWERLVFLVACHAHDCSCKECLADDD